MRGDGAPVVARAPVRVSFGGGGTDLAAYYERFGGFVVSAAIARYSYAVASHSVDGGIGINSADYRVWERFGPGEIPVVADPLRLPKAAIEWFAGHGLAESGMELFLAAEVPPGSGLGSSSAMAVALVRALAGYLGLEMDAAGAADLASWLEIDRLGMPIGKQDQYASAFGGINALEFRNDGIVVTPLELDSETISNLEEQLLLFSTGHTRDSSSILREQRADTVDKASVIEGLHRIKELAVEMRDALQGGHLDRFGELLDLGWRQKRELSGKVSSEVIDGWYAAARRAGALGGKITGAGGGGFLLLYCPLPAKEEVRATMTRLGLRELSFGFDVEGARVVAGDVPTERFATTRCQTTA
ncbi:MAG: GHMP kinase [Chloroflexota bacterium]|nr:GHMP kinase [Chloroflexota bacterium]